MYCVDPLGNLSHTRHYTMTIERTRTEERNSHLHSCGGHWKVVIHLCYARRQVLKIPGMPLDLRDGYPAGGIGHQDV